MYIPNLDQMIAEAIEQYRNEDPVTKAWRTGDLSYKVFDYQAIIKNKLTELVNSSDINRIEPYVLNCSRRFGKSSMGLLTFIEEALKNPGHTYLFVAPTEGEAKEIVLDVMPVLLQDAPDAFKPEFKNSRYTFPNGSTIKIGGVYNGGETLRGRAAHGAFIDEAAHIKQTSANNGLEYVLNSVIRPQLLTTKGWCVIASTPPPQLAHEYVNVYNRARASGRLAHFTVYDNTNISAEYREKLKADMLLSDPTGSSWKREYLAEFAIDTRALIIPNWNTEAMTGTVDRPLRFNIYDRYVSYDHGTTDLSVFLFGYWHWELATLVIEDELVIGGGAVKLSTGEIAQMYNDHRNNLWPHLNVRREICDAINQQVIIDFNRDFGTHFVPPIKTNLEAMTNQLINLVGNNQILINADRCPMLVQTLEMATWKTQANGKREFARLPGIGHCDALAALIYMARTVNRHNNPHANAPAEVTDINTYVVKKYEQQGTEAVLDRALSFGRRKQTNNRSSW